MNADPEEVKTTPRTPAGISADIPWLLLAGLAVSLLATWIKKTPGYMDAAYYYAGGVQLFSGNGFVEPFLWNYLDNPAGIPHPANTYWMPLPSILAMLGMLFTQSSDYFSARLVFMFLAALQPALTAILAFQLTRQRQYARMAGLLALFPGFYAVFASETETFAPYMFLGTLFFLVCCAKIPFFEQKTLLRSLALGLIAGLMHLSRADGILWIAAALGIEILSNFRGMQATTYRSSSLLKGTSNLLAILLAYLLVLSPWFFRNLQEFNRLFPLGGNRTLWLTHYNQTFIYPPELLSFQNWLAAGWDIHLVARLKALGLNLLTVLGVQGFVFLLPPICAGLWHYRKETFARSAAAIWGVTLLVMSFVFPFAGSRGGFFHSCTAIQPIFWAIAPAGLDQMINLGIQKRGWDRRESTKVFRTGVILLAAFLSGWLFYQRVIGPEPQHPLWSKEWENIIAIEQQLQSWGYTEDLPVLVNNTPAYFAATGRPALSVPDGDSSTLLQVAQRYAVRLVILKAAHSEGLTHLYQNPLSPPAGLVYRGQLPEDAYLFEVNLNILGAETEK